MNEGYLNRATKNIDKEDFITLTNLHLEYEWLRYESEALFELWCLSDNIDQKNLIKLLIINFCFIDSRKLNDGCKTISTHIERIWNLNADSTYLVATCDDRKPDGSQMLIQNLKNKFSKNWRESNFFNSITIGANEIKDFSTIVLVDDFIGTGDTIMRKLKYLIETIEKRSLRNINIKIVSFAAMDFSKEVLKNKNIDYFSVHWLKKGIEDLVDQDQRGTAIKAMESMEDHLKKEYQGKKLPNFGYKRSEALFAIESFNIPNNVFPIFWWPFLKGGVERKTLFQRI